MGNKKPNPHPWGDFLRARAVCLRWLRDDMGNTPEQICEKMRMDPGQVRLILATPLSQLPGGKELPMGDIAKIIEEIRCRARKVEMGRWKTWGTAVMADPLGTSNVEDGVEVARCPLQPNGSGGSHVGNAYYITAAQPENVLAIIDAHEQALAAKDAEIEELRRERDRLAMALRKIKDRHQEDCDLSPGQERRLNRSTELPPGANTCQGPTTIPLEMPDDGGDSGTISVVPAPTTFWGTGAAAHATRLPRNFGVVATQQVAAFDPALCNHPQWNDGMPVEEWRICGNCTRPAGDKT